MRDQVLINVTFLASETAGGCGNANEQETLGNVPCSVAQSSTLKHLKLLSSDFLPFPFLSWCLNPPNRGAPGVPGVTGVEGADGTSSLSIKTEKQLNRKINKITKVS